MGCLCLPLFFPHFFSDVGTRKEKLNKLVSIFSAEGEGEERTKLRNTDRRSHFYARNFWTHDTFFIPFFFFFFSSGKMQFCFGQPTCTSGFLGL